MKYILLLLIPLLSNGQKNGFDQFLKNDLDKYDLTEGVSKFSAVDVTDDGSENDSYSYTFNKNGFIEKYEKYNLSTDYYYYSEDNLLEQKITRSR